MLISILASLVLLAAVVGIVSLVVAALKVSELGATGLWALIVLAAVIMLV